MAFLRGLMGADQGEDPPIIKKLEKIKTIVEEKLIPAIDKFKDKAWPKIKEALEWTIDKGLPQMLEDVADLIDDLSRVIGDGDWKGFVENFNALEGALLALGGVKVLTGLADIRDHISRILQLFGVGGAAGGAGGVAGQVEPQVEAVDCFQESLRLQEMPPPQ